MAWCDVLAVWFGLRQDGGTTPLYIASEVGHDAVVGTLLASGANVNQATTVSDVSGLVPCLVCSFSVMVELVACGSL